eukprot:1177122-Prorocentrum_minimum.AAC.1
MSRPSATLLALRGITGQCTGGSLCRRLSWIVTHLALRDSHLGETVSVEFPVRGKLANLLVFKPASDRSSLLHEVQRAGVDQDLHLFGWIIEWRRALFQAAPVDRTGPQLQRGERGVQN